MIEAGGWKRGSSFNHKAWRRIDKLPVFDLPLKVQDHALCAFQVVLFYWFGKV